MFKKDLIRRKILGIRRKRYFQVDPNFFIPLNSYLKKKSKNQNLLLSIYYPSNFEVDILPLFKVINNKKIKTLLPVIKSKEKMNFVEWNFLDTLKVNNFGMLEPNSNGKFLIPDIMLVPLIAFDKTKNRLGYGKGFYDRFLNKFLKVKKKITTIGIAFSFQRYKKLPKSKHDVSLDYILTEKGME